MTMRKKFSYTELIKIANIEQKLKKNGNITNHNGLTEHEVQLLLEGVINQARRILAKSFGVTDIEDLDLQGLCGVAQTIIYKLLINMELNPKCLALSNILDNNYIEDHKINVIDFPMADGISKTYLLDITYKQFLAEDYTPQVIKYWNNDLARKKVLISLLRNGYLELTPENASLYAGSFLFTYRYHPETLINKKTKEQYLLDFINPSKQDILPCYDDEYLKYTYGITQDDLKTPLILMFAGRDNKEKKSWILETDQKAKIQTESAKIAENYKKQQETQTSNQPLQQQENIKE